MTSGSAAHSSSQAIILPSLDSFTKNKRAFAFLKHVNRIFFKLWLIYPNNPSLFPVNFVRFSRISTSFFLVMLLYFKKKVENFDSSGALIMADIIYDNKNWTMFKSHDKSSFFFLKSYFMFYKYRPIFTVKREGYERIEVEERNIIMFRGSAVFKLARGKIKEKKMLDWI